MKKLLYPLILMLIFVGCNRTDYEELTNRMEDIEDRVAALERLCKRMNNDLLSLQSVVSALQHNDFITKITPVKDGETVIGYVIEFSKSQAVTIYHGKDGEDGHTPQLGVRKDTDGNYYWTKDGEWLTDSEGRKIKAGAEDGKDGITPQMKIEDGYWYVSCDNGKSWKRLGKATGEDGKNYTSIFKDISDDENYIYLTLADDAVIQLPKRLALSVTFDSTDNIQLLPSHTYRISYRVTGGDETTEVKAISQNGISAVVKASDHSSGIIEVTVGNIDDIGTILVFVSDGKERTVMRCINFIRGVLTITTDQHTIGYEGGVVSVPLSTNLEYTVEIPETDREWLSVAETRSDIRHETLSFTATPNDTGTTRFSVVSIQDNLGTTAATLLIEQKNTPTTIHVASAGTLHMLIPEGNISDIRELILTGHLDTNDYAFINTISGLQSVDLLGLSDANIPSGAFANSTIPTVILPVALKSIGERAFYNSALSHLSIPETVQTIGESAFASIFIRNEQIVIPDSTVAIGAYAFSDINVYTSSLSLVLGNSLRIIGQSAFANTSLVGNLLIPDSVTLMENGAFSKTFSEGDTLTLGKGLKTINNNTFSNCTFYGDLIIPDNIESIGDGAFSRSCYNCDRNKLKARLILGRGVKAVGTGAFHDSCFTGPLIIPDNVTEIGDNAFYDGAFTEIVIGDGITIIPNSAFAGCWMVKNIDIGKNVGHIGNHAFYCGGEKNFDYDGGLVTDLVIPNCVESIGDNAFCGIVSSPGTLSLHLGKNISIIGNEAFCYSVNRDAMFHTVYCKAATVPILGENVFGDKNVGYDTYFPSALVVPVGSKQLYETSRYDWSAFERIEEKEF